MAKLSRRILTPNAKAAFTAQKNYEVWQTQDQIIRYLVNTNQYIEKREHITPSIARNYLSFVNLAIGDHVEYDNPENAIPSFPNVKLKVVTAYSIALRGLVISAYNTSHGDVKIVVGVELDLEMFTGRMRWIPSELLKRKTNWT